MLVVCFHSSDISEQYRGVKCRSKIHQRSSFDFRGIAIEIITCDIPFCPFH